MAAGDRGHPRACRPPRARVGDSPEGDRPRHARPARRRPPSGLRGRDDDRGSCPLHVVGTRRSPAVGATDCTDDTDACVVICAISAICGEKTRRERTNVERFRAFPAFREWQVALMLLRSSPPLKSAAMPSHRLPPPPAPGWQRRLTFGRIISAKNLTVFTRQLATLVRAGLPIMRALEVLARQEKNAAFRGVLLDLRETIRAGGSFSDGLRRHPRVFDRL